MWRAIFDPIGSFLTSDLLPDFIGPRLDFTHMLDAGASLIHFLHKRYGHFANLGSLLKKLAEFFFRQVLPVVRGG